MLNPWMRLSTWNPWAEMQRLQTEMNRLFADLSGEAAAEVPPINVWTGEKGLRIFAELPGYRHDDIDVSVVGDTLTLKGTRKAEEHGQNLIIHRQERASGNFVRTFQLPFHIEESDVTAHFKNGVLEIDLPRARAERPRRIAITAGSKS